MSLTHQQTEYLIKARKEWREVMQPFSTWHAEHLFGKIPEVPSCATDKAILFGNREDAVRGWTKNGIIAELGTQSGYYADLMLRHANPQELHLFDLEFDSLRGSNPQIAEDQRVTLHQGDSSQCLAKLPDAHFDIVYVDADHSETAIRRDVVVAIAKLKPGGLLIFNDYVLWSIMEHAIYGTVPVVNSLLASCDWVVKYFALHPLMYCDIAVTRASS